MENISPIAKSVSKFNKETSDKKRTIVSKKRDNGSFCYDYCFFVKSACFLRSLAINPFFSGGATSALRKLRMDKI